MVTILGCSENTPEIQKAGATQSPQKSLEPVEPPNVVPAVVGKVIAVKDGDTIVVLNDRKEITVRLEGIDCPESGQAFGNKAKQATSELCFGKMVRLSITGEDRYGRTLAGVTLPDGRVLNQELVSSGYAWWFQKYSDNPTLRKLEAEAKENTRGLWGDSRSIPPWEWRAAQRAKTDLPPSEIKVVANGVEIVALLPNPAGEDAGNEQVTIENSGNVAVDLSKWKLIDKAGNAFLLSGRIGARKSAVVTMTEASMPLNNNGDTLVLVDSEGVGRSRVSYSEQQVRSGVVIQVGQ